MKKAVIYTRISGNVEVEKKHAEQSRACMEFAESKGLSVEHVYFDCTSTGKNQRAWNQIMERSKERTFQNVIVQSIDRISRNKKQFAIDSMRLADNGVKILWINDPSLSDMIEMLAALQKVVKW